MSGESVVGPWAETKLSYLADYLAAYTTILKGQTRWCKNYIYVDAFAGPGRHHLRSKEQEVNSSWNFFEELTSDYSNDPEQGAIIDGSPRRALSITHPFTEYLFIEKSQRRIAHLRDLEHEFPHCCIKVEQGECANVLADFVKKHDWGNERAFVFLDPFGMQVHWNLIVALAETKAIEILLNFPVGMAIQRLLTRDPTKLGHAMLDQYFGTDEWFSAMYVRSHYQQMSFFDDELEDAALIKVPDSGKKLVRWYKDRLLGIFPHVSNAGLVRNSRKCPLYYLIHATHKAVATRIMNHILGDDVVA